MAVHYETGGSEEGFKIVDAWSSKGTKYPGQEELHKKWRSFDNYDDEPITVATIMKMLADQGDDWLDVLNEVEPGFEDCEMKVVQTADLAKITRPEHQNPLDKYSLKGKSADLEKITLEEVAIAGDIAFLGEYTVLFAPPNTGKTLLLLWLLLEAIKSGKIDPTKLYYVNVDDNLKGLTQKVRIAEEFGFHMLADGHREFKATELRAHIQEMAENDQAHGIVIVLDTLKKFVGLMDKSKVTSFNNLVRRFVGKGGTVIALAHTNKKRDAEGKLIYGGTSDVVDDADCAYIIDVVDKSDSTNKIIEFENIKRRGNNVAVACYRYSQESRQSYESLLASVSPVDETQLLDVKREVKSHDDAPIIHAVEAAIRDGVNTKMKLVDAVAQSAGCSKRTALRVIEKYTGTDPTRHRWRFSVQERGAKVYELLTSTTDD
jgi:hypothetical protein